MNYIRGYIQSNEASPTNAEIGRHFGFRSSATVHQIVDIIISKGFLERTPNVSRGLKLATPKSIWGKPPFRVVRDMRGLGGPAVWMVKDASDRIVADLLDCPNSERRARAFKHALDNDLLSLDRISP